MSQHFDCLGQGNKICSHTMLKSAYASFEGANGSEARSEARQRVGLRSAATSPWYSPEELDAFVSTGTSAKAADSSDQGAAVNSSVASDSGLSFYGKGPQLSRFSPPSRPKRPERDYRERDREREAMEELTEQMSSGRNVFVMPKRPPRTNECYALDKDIAAASTPNDALDIAIKQAHLMDAPNWANLLYALAHCKKKGNSFMNASSLRADPRWLRSCKELQSSLGELTARDSANVIWSLATLDAKQEPLFLETASSLCNTKLAVCDPVSLSKTAWALTSIPNRDRRLDLYSKLAVPVVLRADSFPLGSLTMISYSFGKADFREGDAYEALSSALTGHMDDQLRPIDVCNVIWSFCTVGFRDDVLFSKMLGQIAEHFWIFLSFSIIFRVNNSFKHANVASVLRSLFAKMKQKVGDFCLSFLAAWCAEDLRDVLNKSGGGERL